MDDTSVLNNEKVLTAHNVQVFADNTIQGEHNLLVGRNVVAAASAANNTVVGENVFVPAGVENSTSLGRNNFALTRSDTFQLGEFLSYRQDVGELRLVEDAVGVNRSGKVSLGRNGEVLVTPTETSIAAPVQLRGATSADEGWQFTLETSSDDPGARDLVFRSSDGTSVSFCSGGPQVIS